MKIKRNLKMDIAGIRPNPNQAQTPHQRSYKNIVINYESMRGFPQAQEAVENIAAKLEKSKHLSYHFSMGKTFDDKNRKVIGRIEVESRKTPQRSKIEALKLIAKKNKYNPLQTVKDFLYIHIPHQASTLDLTEQGIAAASKRARIKAITFREPLMKHLRKTVLIASRFLSR